MNRERSSTQWLLISDIDYENAPLLLSNHKVRDTKNTKFYPCGRSNPKNTPSASRSGRQGMANQEGSWKFPRWAWIIYVFSFCLITKWWNESRPWVTSGRSTTDDEEPQCSGIWSRQTVFRGEVTSNRMMYLMSLAHSSWKERALGSETVFLFEGTVWDSSST